MTDTGTSGGTTFHYRKGPTVERECWSSCEGMGLYRRYGHELERMSEHAVLNANYLRHKITKPASNGNQSGAFTEGAPASVVKHEFTLNMTPLKEENGVTAKDVAKTLGLWLHGPDALLPTNSAGVPDVRANRDGIQGGLG